MKALTTALTTTLAIALLALLLPAGPVMAVQPDEVLADPVLEARARDISTELRCVVCQNQSIDDSNADIARDLRLLVRERLVAGDTDEQVVDYIVARYGDFVLLKPPFQPNTFALWLGPPIMAVVIATLAVMFFRTYQSRRAASAGFDPLSPDDRAELDALVERIADSTPPPSRHSTFRDELESGLRGVDKQEQSGEDTPRENEASDIADKTAEDDPRP